MSNEEAPKELVEVAYESAKDELTEYFVYGKLSELKIDRIVFGSV